MGNFNTSDLVDFLGRGVFQPIMDVIQTITGPNIIDRGIGDVEALGRGVERQFENTLYVVQDIERGGIKTVDNARSDMFYTVRDTKSEFLTTVDSAIDNALEITDKHITNLFETIQISALAGFTITLIFLILYGDKVFQNGIKLGNINLL